MNNSMIDKVVDELSYLPDDVLHLFEQEVHSARSERYAREQIQTAMDCSGDYEENLYD